jgi:hypothetical protein
MVVVVEKTFARQRSLTGGSDTTSDWRLSLYKFAPYKQRRQQRVKDIFTLITNMPVARSTRRTRARELSSDHIEEEEHSQHHRRDSVQDDEEEQPRRKSRQVKKEKPTLTKGKGKGKVQNVPEDDDGGEGDNAASRIDVDNFHDQPLNRSDVNRLAGLAKDWETTRKGFHASSFRMMNDIGAALAEVDEEDKVVRKSFHARSPLMCSP